MQKPNGYAETPAGGDFTPIELGGHYLIIKQVKEMKSQSGKDMIVVMFDFANNDKQAGYFMDSYKADTREDKKWSNQATQYIVCQDADNKCSRSFKSFCTCVENSNKGFSCWKGNELDLAGLKDKKVGGVFGEQLDFYDNKERRKRVLRWFCSADKVSSAEVPVLSETKAYKDSKNNGSLAMSENNDFMNIPDSIDEELPFK